EGDQKEPLGVALEEEAFGAGALGQLTEHLLVMLLNRGDDRVAAVGEVVRLEGTWYALSGEVDQGSHGLHELARLALGKADSPGPVWLLKVIDVAPFVRGRLVGGEGLQELPHGRCA